MNPAEPFVRLFAFLFRVFLHRSLDKELPKNKWVDGGALMFGVFAFCMIAFLVDEFFFSGGQAAHLVIAGIAFPISFFAMLKGFSGHLTNREK